MRQPRSSVGILRQFLWLFALALVARPSVGRITQLEWLGEARIAGGTTVSETPVGGLSGITYDGSRDLYYVVVDDPSARGPARFYTLEIDLSGGHLSDDGVRVVDMTVIQSPAGGPMPKMSVDPEGIALHPDGSVYISSEGQVRRQVALFVRHFDLEGRYLGELPLPEGYRPGENGSNGPRHNLGFESLTATPDGRFLFTALENALIQDGPAAALEVVSPSRILKFDLANGERIGEFLYYTEPVAKASSVPDGLEVNGVVDMLALDEQNLLSMERSFSMGVGNTIQIFQLKLDRATDIRALSGLREVGTDGVVPVEKRLLFDLDGLGIYLDNLEGMTLGPPLADGRRTLILVSDDNFNPLVQTSQILAFAIGSDSVDVERIQGADHESPLAGRWVIGVDGVVTAIYPGKEQGFWMESTLDDGDRATSRGVLVVHDDSTPAPVPGDHVILDGQVVETRRPGDLGTTTVRASRARIVDSGNALPPPVRLGPEGLAVPSEVVDDDRLQVFEPQFDGLDFWESLEGMRVVLVDAPVIGPTSKYGDIVVDAGRSSNTADSTAAGGLFVRPGDLNPERLTVDFSGMPGYPDADVGSRFAGGLTGVIGYRFSSYRLYLQSPVPRLVSGKGEPETTDLTPGRDRLTVTTFNVLNLSARSPASHFESLARDLTVSMKGPDIVALQEIQDDSGPVDDGTVSAASTLRRLIEAIAEAGGPRYDYRQIDPVDKGDGGQPGSNIRPAFLFNSSRVTLVDRGEAGGPLDAVQPLEGVDGVGLSANPGRISPAVAAFNGDESRGFSASRKPLVGEFEFESRRLFVVNNHWSSKSPDDAVFGEVQPPVRHSEDQRSQQARWVADFVVELLRLDPTAAIVVLGDLNDHEFRAPLRVLTGAPLENLVFQVPREDRYSFNFRGSSQLLDHILVSRPLLERARTRVDIVHSNADFAHSQSSSDHDPLIVELDFSRPD